MPHASEILIPYYFERIDFSYSVSECLDITSNAFQIQNKLDLALYADVLPPCSSSWSQFQSLDLVSSPQSHGCHLESKFTVKGRHAVSCSVKALGSRQRVIQDQLLLKSWITLRKAAVYLYIRLCLRGKHKLQRLRRGIPDVCCD
jgi:hypothetical protein